MASRAEMEKVPIQMYPNSLNWAKRVYRMPDHQVFAMYQDRLKKLEKEKGK